MESIHTHAPTPVDLQILTELALLAYESVDRLRKGHNLAAVSERRKFVMDLSTGAIPLGLHVGLGALATLASQCDCCRKAQSGMLTS